MHFLAVFCFALFTLQFMWSTVGDISRQLHIITQQQNIIILQQTALLSPGALFYSIESTAAKGNTLNAVCSVYVYTYGEACHF